jgi:hypothetical protein
MTEMTELNQVIPSTQIAAMPRPRQSREQRRRRIRIMRSVCALACAIVAGVILGICAASLWLAKATEDVEPVAESALVTFQATGDAEAAVTLLEGIIPLTLDTQSAIFAACGNSAQRFCMAMAIAQVETAARASA